MLDKLKMQSPDLTVANIDKIAALFPNCVTEKADADGKITRGINFERLKQELSSDVIEHYDECYDFTWVGKNAAIAEGNEPAYIKHETLDEKGKVIEKKTPATLRPCVEESKNWEETENLYIEGDNLTVLKLLQESYLNSVKMIYIDPPYNTGKDFIYRDNRRQTIEEYREDAGVYDEDGLIQYSPNLEANPQYHSDWCSMMSPRLRLAKNLLIEDGVIFISIGQDEIHNTIKICDEVFGEENKIGICSRQMKTGSNQGKHFAPNIDYIVVYARNKNYSFPFSDALSEELINKVYNKVQATGLRTGEHYRTMGLFQTSLKHGGSSYPIQCPDGSFVITPNGLPWRVNQDNYNAKLKDDEIVFVETDTSPLIDVNTNEKSKWNIYTKIWLNNRMEAGQLPKDMIIGFENRHSSKELSALNIPFDFPKPLGLIRHLLSITKQKDAIILDFFSGSATTAHAVMQLNAEDGGNRKFIMVQLPELCGEKSEAFKAGYKNICEIGKERIRRAGEKINAKIAEDNAQLKLGEEEKPLVDIGFRVFKTDTTNMKDVYYGAGELEQEQLEFFVSNIKEDRSDLDLLYGVLIDWGLPLSMKHKIIEIEGVKIHDYDDLTLVACFADNVSETVVREIAKMQPYRVVFKDGSFESSPHRLNVEEIFKLNAPNTSVKVI